MEWRRLEINGGVVNEGSPWRFSVPPTPQGYANAQIDDYGFASSRRFYPWRTTTIMQLRACFSHSLEDLQGTAGFGFWNAPYGDPTIRWPALPQATWFFFASKPNDLPFALHGPGQGWFAATVDAGNGRSLSIAPFAPLLLLLNQSQRLRKRLWPFVRRRLGISYAPISLPMDTWHHYRLQWSPAGCTFHIDDQLLLATPASPRGPLGFVCWIDNQYLVATSNGRFAWGTLATEKTQWLEIDELTLRCT